MNNRIIYVDSDGFTIEHTTATTSTIRETIEHLGSIHNAMCTSVFAVDAICTVKRNGEELLVINSDVSQVYRTSIHADNEDVVLTGSSIFHITFDY